MKNKLTDLNDHLFAQLERLSDESLDGAALATELERAKGVTSLANQIVSNARLALDAQKVLADMPNAHVRLPAMLESQ
jgi:hypothetical protein